MSNLGAYTVPILNYFKIIERKEHWRIRHLKGALYMLGYSERSSKPNIEMNVIWEPLIKKAQ